MNRISTALFLSLAVTLPCVAGNGDQRAPTTVETTKTKVDILQLFYQKPNPDGISNVLRAGKEGEAKHVLFAVPPEDPKIIMTYYGDDERLLVFDTKTGKPVVNRTNVNHAVVIQVGKEVLTGTAAGPVPIVSSEVPRDRVREVKTVAGMTVGMANCVEVKGKDGKSLPYMVIFDDGGRLVATHCVNTKPDPNYRLIPCTASAKGLTTTIQLPPDITCVTQIGQFPGGHASETTIGDGGTRKERVPKITQAKGLLPPYANELQGTNPVRVRNPNEFAVATGIRLGTKGKNFDVPATGVQTVYVPNGKYDIYFVYSDKPDALFQGDSFTLNDNGVEIQIVKVVNGNYGIRQVK